MRMEHVVVGCTGNSLEEVGEIGIIETAPNLASSPSALAIISIARLNERLTSFRLFLFWEHLFSCRHFFTVKSPPGFVASLSGNLKLVLLSVMKRSIIYARDGGSVVSCNLLKEVCRPMTQMNVSAIARRMMEGFCDARKS